MSVSRSAPKVKVTAVSAKTQGGKAQLGSTSTAVALSAVNNAQGAPVVAVVAHAALGKEKSGLIWVSRFPTSTSLDDLKEPFKTSAKDFIQALRDADVDVSVNATYRPTERSYLMYYSAKITRGEIDADRVPVWPGVAIDWAHLDSTGKADIKAAKSAARAMVQAYAIGNNPVGAPGKSNHNKKLAMDLSIAKFLKKSVKNPDGDLVSIGDWDDLLELGDDFGVKWFGPKDKPHWSFNGK